jgi:hypothetical protein
MLVVPADGSLALMQFLSTGFALLPYVGLFANNINPTKLTALTDLIEASFPGYTRKYLAGPSSVQAQADGSCIARWNPVVWASTAPMTGQASYGYFVVQLDAALVVRLLWLERVAPVVDWSVPGQTLALTVQLGDLSLFG